MRLFYHLAAILSLCGVSAAVGSGLPSLLEQYKLPVDSVTVQKAADDALIKAIDPGACIVTFEQAAVLDHCSDALEVAERWPEGILYAKFFAFNSKAADALAEELAERTNEVMSGLILDLRSANGDSLEDVDAIAGMFITGGTNLYRLKNGLGEVVEERAARHIYPLGDFERLPLIVLVNNQTVSAPAVLACVIAGRKNALVLGSGAIERPCLRTFIPNGGDKLIYVATRWADFSGSVSNAVGVDVESTEVSTGTVPLPPDKVIGKPFTEKMKTDRALMKRTADDPLLARAADILVALKSTSKVAKSDVKTTKNNPISSGK